MPPDAPTDKQFHHAAALFALRGWSLVVERRDGSQFYRLGEPNGGSHTVSSWHGVVAVLARLQQGAA
jgi:hypothetical protein